jgi:hypothetical protein
LNNYGRKSCDGKLGLDNGKLELKKRKSADTVKKDFD